MQFSNIKKFNQWNSLDNKRRLNVNYKIQKDILERVQTLLYHND